uniref:Xenopsin-related peptide 2 n=2 Tax=Amniota TaxID=32524 RepID=Q7M078_RAT|nr:xenopsin-related peptide [Rattus norvegicus]
FHPKRPWIL